MIVIFHTKYAQKSVIFLNISKSYTLIENDTDIRF